MNNMGKMQIIFSRRYKKGYRRLAPIIQKRTNEKIEMLLQNPLHPSLRIKKVKKYKDLFECSITKNHRFLFEIKKNEYVLHRIGTHNILDKL